MLSVKQGSCEYECLSHWFDPTRNQTRVYSSRDRRSIPLGHLSCYACYIASKRVTSCGIHLGGLAPGQHNSEKTLQLWQVVSDALSGLTFPVIESQTSHTDGDVSSHFTCQYRQIVSRCLYLGPNIFLLISPKPFSN